jgi:ankyrin repeat protein
MAPWPWAKTKAFHKAVVSGDVTKLNRLLQHKRVNVNAKDSKDTTGLHMAVFNKGGRVLEVLLAHDRINVNAQGPGGQTPLHLAISNYPRDYSDSTVVVRAFLKHPLIDVNVPDDDSRTPLHYAVEFDSRYTTRLLVETPGLDYNAQDKQGRTALGWALHLNHPDLAAILVSGRDFVSEAALVDADGNTALYKAANCPDLFSGTMARLVKGQTSTVLDARSTRSPEGEAALHAAARLGNFDAFQELVVAGAGLDVGRGSDGATAVHVAVQCRSLGVMEYVRRLEPPLRKTAISARDNGGNTPLHLAAKLGDYKMLDSVLGLCVLTDELPLRADPVEVARVNDEGETAVELAALHGHIEITMRLLLAEKMASEELPSQRREALLRSVPDMLDTSVAYAMSVSQRTTAELLKYAAAADTLGHIKSLRRHFECSMLSSRYFVVFAAGAGHLDVVQYLAEEGVDFDIWLEYMGTPHSVANAYGRTDVMRFILSLRREA